MSLKSRASVWGVSTGVLRRPHVQHAVYAADTVELVHYQPALSTACAPATRAHKYNMALHDSGVDSHAHSRGRPCADSGISAHAVLGTTALGLFGCTASPDN